MQMEHYPHQEPARREATFQTTEHRQTAQMIAAILPSRMKSFGIGMIIGYSLAIIHIGSLTVLMVIIRLR